jgi:hypothetical protein
MQLVGASTYESFYREVDISKTSEDGKRDIRFNHDEVLAVAKWQRHLREWILTENIFDKIRRSKKRVGKVFLKWRTGQTSG